MNSGFALLRGPWYRRRCSGVAIDDGTCSCGVGSPSRLDQSFGLSPGFHGCGQARLWLVKRCRYGHGCKRAPWFVALLRSIGAITGAFGYHER
jgi:hypothetical protein